jgi:hypothetical protein
MQEDWGQFVNIDAPVWIIPVLPAHVTDTINSAQKCVSALPDRDDHAKPAAHTGDLA